MLTLSNMPKLSVFRSSLSHGNNWTSCWIYGN